MHSSLPGEFASVECLVIRWTVQSLDVPLLVPGTLLAGDDVR